MVLLDISVFLPAGTLMHIILGANCLATMLSWFKPPELLSLGTLKIFGVSNCCATWTNSSCTHYGSLRDSCTTPGNFDHFRHSLQRRAEAFIQAGGGHFKHFFWAWTNSNSVIKHFRTHVVMDSFLLFACEIHFWSFAIESRYTLL